MEPKLIVLKLLLDHLGVEANADTFENRLKMQKAVYLGQRFGINLGYRFGWYHYGPYSPGLTKDYYALRDACAQGDAEYESKAFSPSVLESLKTVQEVVSDIAGDSNCLEASASLDYLINISKMEDTKAESELLQLKPHLRNELNRAKQTLEKLKPQLQHA